MHHTPDITTYLRGRHILPIFKCRDCGIYTPTIHNTTLTPDSLDGFYLEGSCAECAG